MARRETEALPLWFAEWRKYVPKSTVKIVIDNKAEMVCSSLARIALVLFNAAQAYARQVSQAEAAVYAARMGCLFLETSALTAVGVHRAFCDLVERNAEMPGLWAVQGQRSVPLRESLS